MHESISSFESSNGSWLISKFALKIGKRFFGDFVLSFILIWSFLNDYFKIVVYLIVWTVISKKKNFKFSHLRLI